jgi:hypothetical protein
MASSAAMLTVWLILVTRVAGRSPLSRAAASAVFGWLVLPWTVAPLLPLRGLQDGMARELFTDLMRWGIFPPSLVVLVLCVRALLVARRRNVPLSTNVCCIGFVMSAVLTLLGYVLGALITSSTTMVPAHYHAAIGAVTAAFMTVSYPLLEALGATADRRAAAARLTKLQPALFGCGQAVFAVGFAIAGAHGAGRKLYASEGQADSLAQAFGLGVMGLGGLLAIVGGVLYLALVVTAFRRHAHDLWHTAPVPVPEPGGTHG